MTHFFYPQPEVILKFGFKEPCEFKTDIYRYIYLHTNNSNNDQRIYIFCFDTNRTFAMHWLVWVGNASIIKTHTHTYPLK